MTTDKANRLEYLRRELRAERISYGELAELQSLKDLIDPSDVELLEAAGVPEATSTEDEDASPYCTCAASGWHGDGHCAACAVSVIELTEKALDEQKAINRELIEALENAANNLDELAGWDDDPQGIECAAANLRALIAKSKGEQ